MIDSQIRFVDDSTRAHFVSHFELAEDSRSDQRATVPGNRKPAMKFLIVKRVALAGMAKSGGWGLDCLQLDQTIVRKVEADCGVEQWKRPEARQPFVCSRLFFGQIRNQKWIAWVHPLGTWKIHCWLVDFDPERSRIAQQWLALSLQKRCLTHVRRDLQKAVGAWNLTLGRIFGIRIRIGFSSKL